MMLTIFTGLLSVFLFVCVIRPKLFEKLLKFINSFQIWGEYDVADEKSARTFAALSFTVSFVCLLLSIAKMMDLF